MFYSVLVQSCGEWIEICKTNIIIEKLYILVVHARFTNSNAGNCNKKTNRHFVLFQVNTELCLLRIFFDANDNSVRFTVKF